MNSQRLAGLRRARAHLYAAALFLLLAAGMLWPLPRLIARAAADRTSALAAVWIQDWHWYATVHRGAEVFPSDARPFTEYQYGVALFGFPLRAAGAPPLLTSNILLLAGFAFTGYAMFVLVRMVTGSWWAGVAGGIVFAFAPWRFLHLGEPQLAWAGWLPLMLAALIAFGRDPTWLRALALAVTFVLNGITSLHWLVFGSAAVVLAAPVFLIRRPRALLGFAAALLVSSALLIPFLLPYRGALPGPGDAERPPFPGFAVTALALIGMLGPIAADAVSRRLVLLVSTLWIVLGLCGALGAFPFIPLSPGPWTMVAYAGAAVLAGIGAMKLARGRHWAGALVAAVLLHDLRAAPHPWQLIDPDEPPVHRWLAESEDRGAIVELPAGPAHAHESLFRSTVHHRRVVLDEDIARAFARRPVDLSVIDAMKRRGVTALVVHGDALRDDTAAIRYFLLRGFDAGRLRLAGRFDHGVEGDFVFTFGRGDLKPYFGPQPASRPFGWLDEPQAGAEVRGPVRVLGWALAPDGIRRVRVYLNNRERWVDAQLFPRPDVAALYPWHDASRSGFTVDVPRDREGPTDVEVEITDLRGRTVRLGQRWFVWAR